MSFHHFSQLPAELRLIIWSHAIRTSQPGAHFFASPPSLFLASDSAHLHDVGLWSASYESRQVMLSRYPQPSPYNPLPSINPITDLACFNLTSTVPPPLVWTITHGSLLNLALEFTPAWPDFDDLELTDIDHTNAPPPQSSPLTAFMQILEVLADHNPNKRLWLIDRSLTLLPSARRYVAVFHGLNASYIEAEREDCLPASHTTAFDLYDYLAEFLDQELRDRRHWANVGWPMDECEDCEDGTCDDDDFRLHDILGVLVPRLRS